MDIKSAVLSVQLDIIKEIFVYAAYVLQPSWFVDKSLKMFFVNIKWIDVSIAVFSDFLFVMFFD